MFENILHSILPQYSQTGDQAPAGCYNETIEDIVENEEVVDTEEVNEEIAEETIAPEPEGMSTDEMFEHLEGWQTSWNAFCQPPSIVEMYNKAHFTACRMVGKGKEPTFDYPAPKRSPEPPIWYKVSHALVNAPIWRLLFIVAVIAIGCATIHSSMDNMNDILGVGFAWIVLGIIIVLNTVTGLASNLIRVLFHMLMTEILQIKYTVDEYKAAKAAVGGTRSLKVGKGIIKQ